MLRTRRLLTAFPVLATLPLWLAPLAAAEINLHAECKSDGGLILLKDVADIFGQDSEAVKKLGEIDLLPAPPAGDRRRLRAREIQDILVSRGVNLREHRFSGASQVQLIGTLETPPPRKSASQPPVQFLSPRQASDAVRQALVAYLGQQEGGRDDWDLKFTLAPEQVQTLAQAPQTLAISGGSEPWTGPQQFTLTVTVEGQEKTVPLRAEVTLPPTVVVATRSLPKGTLLQAADVRLQPGVAAQGSAHVFQSLEEVVGKEVQRGVVEGQILDEQWVRRPILVHKGEIITVYARTNGIQIRTTARARDEGARGDLVTVETLADHKTFFARVTAPQEVDVYAHAAGVAPDGPEATASAGIPRSGLAANDPLPPLPLVKNSGRRAGLPDGEIQQVSVAGKPGAKAGAPTLSKADPSSVLYQAALRGKTVRDQPAAKQSIVRRKSEAAVKSAEQAEQAAENDNVSQ